MGKRYIFVVDTEQYAGNFERELGAFLTGVIGDCGVGDDFAELYRSEEKYGFEDAVLQVPDEHGCARPAAIYPTNGWYNDGMGNHVREGSLSDEDALKQYRATRAAYFQGLLSREQTNTAREHFRTEIENAMKEPLTRHPAYLSVGIHFVERPTEAQVSLMKARAARFSDAYVKSCKSSTPVTITGFRIVCERTACETESV